MGKIRPYKERKQYPSRPPYERFMEKFKVNKKTGCWIWTGSHGGLGYAVLFLYKIKGTNKSVRIYAHRFSYMIFVGDIPPDKEIDHICRVRDCVNPAHLRLVSHRENMLLGETIAAINASKTHCAKGHPYDKKNTRITKDGSRMCKTCFR